jgi:hypothetical protein
LWGTSTIWFHFICMLLLCLCLFDLCTLFNLYIFLVKLYMPSTLRGTIVHWKQLLLFSNVNTERVPFGTTQKRRSLRKRLENIKAHLKLSFVRDKYIPLKREYIKSSNCFHKSRTYKSQINLNHSGLSMINITFNNISDDG